MPGPILMSAPPPLIASACIGAEFAALRASRPSLREPLYGSISPKARVLNDPPYLVPMPNSRLRYNQTRASELCEGNDFIYRLASTSRPDLQRSTWILSAFR